MYACAMRGIRNFFANLARLTEVPPPECSKHFVLKGRNNLPVSRSAARRVVCRFVLPTSALEERGELLALSEMTRLSRPLRRFDGIAGQETVPVTQSSSIDVLRV
jgi:hypothetical protein